MPRKSEDLSNKKFNFLTVIKKDDNLSHKGTGVYWKCECICGKIKIISTSHLKNNQVKSCGCKRFKIKNSNDIVGHKFNSLTVIKDLGTKDVHKHKRRIILCKCDCGRIVERPRGLIANGYTKSCGCECFEKDENGNSKLRKKRIEHSNGYIKIYKPTHPNADRIGYVLEHKFVMSEYLGRPIKKGETIHHKNGKRDQNNIENLELWANGHPYGQRIEDLLKFAYEIINKYKDYQNPTIANYEI